MQDLSTGNVVNIAAVCFMWNTLPAFGAAAYVPTLVGLYWRIGCLCPALKGVQLSTLYTEGVLSKGCINVKGVLSKHVLSKGCQPLLAQRSVYVSRRHRMQCSRMPAGAGAATVHQVSPQRTDAHLSVFSLLFSASCCLWVI